jgi:uncharacterized protein
MAAIRPLDPIEIRVLGSLLEKQQTTPEQYPLTLNALLAACNQKSNREPVTELSERDVFAALERLKKEALVWRLEGARADRYEHLLDRRLGLTPPVKAVVTLLFLRGVQTPGELRTRSERMHEFASVEAVEQLLGSLAARDEPLVTELPRRPGQRESRWKHLLALVTGQEEPELPLAPEAPSRSGLAERVARLEEEVATLRTELATLKAALE